MEKSQKIFYSTSNFFHKQLNSLNTCISSNFQPINFPFTESTASPKKILHFREKSVKDRSQRSGFDSVSYDPFSCTICRLACKKIQWNDLKNFRITSRDFKLPSEHARLEPLGQRKTVILTKKLILPTITYIAVATHNSEPKLVFATNQSLNLISLANVSNPRPQTKILLEKTVNDRKNYFLFETRTKKKLMNLDFIPKFLEKRSVNKTLAMSVKNCSNLVSMKKNPLRCFLYFLCFGNHDKKIEGTFVSLIVKRKLLKVHKNWDVLPFSCQRTKKDHLLKIEKNLLKIWKIDEKKLEDELVDAEDKIELVFKLNFCSSLPAHYNYWIDIFQSEKIFIFFTNGNRKVFLLKIAYLDQVDSAELKETDLFCSSKLIF